MLRSGNLTFYPFVRCQNMIFKDFRPLEMYGFWLRLMEFIFTKIWPSKLSVFCFCKEMLRIGALCVIPISWLRQRLWKVCQWRFFSWKRNNLILHHVSNVWFSFITSRTKQKYEIFRQINCKSSATSIWRIIFLSKDFF